jgi:hypothetical protein
MPNGREAGSEPAITQILRALIEEYGAALHLPVGNNAIARFISEEARIAHGTVLGILNGVPDRIALNTRNRLADFFNRVAIPTLRSEWFSSASLADFNMKRASAGFVAVKLAPNHNRLMEIVEHWLCGIHILYRYSLDSIDTGNVAREVAMIWNAGPNLMHRISFVPHSSRESEPIYYFEGPVILVGRSAVLISTNVGQESQDRDRARVIILDHGDGESNTQDCKLGLLTSTRPRQDFAPCTASTLMIRTQWNTDQTTFQELVDSATTIRPLEDTIREDFGTAHEELIRVFLDNRPLGCPVEPELEPFAQRVPEGGHDRVVRIDTDRFSRNMKRILTAVMSDDTICAPFKPNWLSSMRGMNKTP